MSKQERCETKKRRERLEEQSRTQGRHTPDEHRFPEDRSRAQWIVEVNGGDGVRRQWRRRKGLENKSEDGIEKTKFWCVELCNWNKHWDYRHEFREDSMVRVSATLGVDNVVNKTITDQGKSDQTTDWRRHRWRQSTDQPNVVDDAPVNAILRFSMVVWQDNHSLLSMWKFMACYIYLFGTFTE